MHVVEIKSTFCAFNASMKCSLWLCFSSPIKTRFAGLLIGSWVFFKKLSETTISYCFNQSLEWWRVPGSNRWPPACKAGALPAELTPHQWFEVVGQNGLEPSTSRLSVVCSSQLSYWPIFSFHIIFKVHLFLYPLNWITHQFTSFHNPCTDLRTLLTDTL